MQFKILGALVQFKILGAFVELKLLGAFASGLGFNPFESCLPSKKLRPHCIDVSKGPRSKALFLF